MGKSTCRQGTLYFTSPWGLGTYGASGAEYSVRNINTFEVEYSVQYAVPYSSTFTITEHRGTPAAQYIHSPPEILVHLLHFSLAPFPSEWEGAFAFALDQKQHQHHQWTNHHHTIISITTNTSII